jgi:hypothetical protein
MLVGVAPLGIARKVELDDVVLRASDELIPLGLVDNVVRRSDDVSERADLVEVVVERLEWKHLRHDRGTLAKRGAATPTPALRRRDLDGW